MPELYKPWMAIGVKKVRAQPSPTLDAPEAGRGMSMTEVYIGTITLFAFPFPPQGYALCNGQIINISQNQALFALIGTTYGGNGQTTFALPNLQSRVPIHQGQGPGLSPYQLGQTGGSENVTLTIQQMPQHNHGLIASDQPASQPGAAGGYLPSNATRGGVVLYASSVTANQTMNNASISPTGSSQGHANIQPYQCVSYCIALQGLFPSRN